jgi:hypothetical protein
MPANILTDAQFESMIDVWHKQHVSHPSEGHHLSEERIFELAIAKNLIIAPDHEITHLSTCPLCMDDWSFWVNVQNDDDCDVDSQYPVLSGGMLRAAASPGTVEVLRLPSFCGRFTLGILPEINNPERGLITLETVAEFEARTAEVRDSHGRIILQGRFAQGRIAGRCDDLKEIDPGAWSIIIH